MTTCKRCNKREAIWAMQYMDGPNKPPSFSFLGSHYRGYKVTKVCDPCRQSIKDDHLWYAQQEADNDTPD